MSDIQIIGMDLSHSKGFTVISSVCGSCGYLLEIEDYDPKINGCSFTVFKECPKCGVMFNEHVIRE